ncbi:MAG: T9SS type A sorting domain-containing protein [Ignavibacteriae bacterium]|nr:T9SS C-terminal target domain-containing protein [Ignavibacteriota bacterium]NOG96595.1 T9SS type A sorting domain-containing protein [Ignavibacteriota bacterium]
MKAKLLIAFLLIFLSQTFAQYPEITIKDINFVPDDSLLFYGALNSEPQPPLVGDTVTVVGVVMCPPYEGANPDSIVTLHAGAPSIYLQDTSMTEWSGVLTRFTGSPVPAAYQVLDSGFVIKATGVVVEYFTTTELDLIDFQASDIIGQMKRPEPVLLPLDSLVEIGTPNPNYLAEKWEGVYVEFRNLTVTGSAIGNQSFYVQDENGSQMIVYTTADWWRRKPSPPLPGTKIDMVRGYIANRNNIAPDWFLINPVFEEDIVFGDVIPPNIFSVQRDIANVTSSSDVVVTAVVNDADGTIDNAKLYYSVNSAADIELPMTFAGDSNYTATIPSGAYNDGDLVTYYVEATDNGAAVSTNPADPDAGRYFFRVLDNGLTISDVQYTPFENGISGYDSYTVTVSGIVTADTTDIEGDGSNTGPQVVIQDGAGPWSAIQLFGTEVLDLRKGDDVTVTGVVDENFGVTRIEDVDAANQLVINGTAAVPEPTPITTDVIGTSSSGTLPAESYESVLVKYTGLTVVNENADGTPGPGGSGNSNFGEMLVADASNIQTRVELQDGTHNYHNFWDAALENEPNRITTGTTISDLTGIMFYSFGNYKLVPRTNSDFGVVVDVKDEVVIPEEYSLAQNYPNPFNPSTTIEYTMPEAGLVKIVVYNVLGQEIVSLVNQMKSQGSHKVTFDASNLPSGIYFYKMESNNFVQTKKLMLLK